MTSSLSPSELTYTLELLFDAAFRLYPSFIKLPSTHVMERSVLHLDSEYLIGDGNLLEIMLSKV